MSTYTKTFIADKLASNDTWLLKGVVAIYKKQTASEQVAGITRENNSVGFNAVDSIILSSFAMQINTFNNTPARLRRFRSPLSPKQLVIARRKMLKYAGQLAVIANAGVQQRLPEPAVVADMEDLSEEEQYNRVHSN